MSHAINTIRTADARSWILCLLLCGCVLGCEDSALRSGGSTGTAGALAPPTGVDPAPSFDEVAAGCTRGVYEGDFTIGYPEAVRGLSGFQEVSGALIIDSGASSPDSLHGLECLTAVGGLRISWSGLRTVEGLHRLSTVRGDLTIEASQVESLEGLRGLSRVDGSVHFYANAMDDLTGLEGLTSIGGGLTVLSDLSSLHGLEGLETVGGELRISNSGIEDLSGLESLTSIGGGLSIAISTRLVSIAGLDQLTSLGGPLWINDNPMLPQCQVVALAARLGTVCSCDGNLDAGALGADCP